PPTVDSPPPRPASHPTAHTPRGGDPGPHPTAHTPRGGGPGSRSTLRSLLVSLLAGIATGLFLGDKASVFDIAANAFVKLLQMAVLPYVTVSIVASIGGLRVEDLRRLGGRTALVMAGLWLMALTFAFLMPITFPPT